MFLHLDVGLTRGKLPDLEQELRHLQQKLEQSRRQLTAKDRQLEQTRNRLSREGQRVTGASDGGTGAATVETRKDRFRSEVEEVLDLIPADFGGGCSVSKAFVIASLIREYDLKTTVDIGVYRGRSLFPQALAHRRFTGGIVYGVDPWSAAEARENDNEELKEAIERFVDRADFHAIYREVESLRSKLGYEDYCALVRKTSTDAADEFKGAGIKFDLVHVDGNHDTARVVEDVESYLPRLRDGGYIILDDVSWDSVKPAYAVLESKSTLIFERIDGPDDYAIFMNASPSTDVRANRNFVERAADSR